MKRAKLIFFLAFCLLSAIQGWGQISLDPPGIQQNEDFQLQQYRQVADSGYMILTYDDGIAENYCAWQLAGNMMAVKFNLQSYAGVVKGARVYVGDGSYPVGGNILNQPFLVSVYDSDGANGMAGTLVDSVSAVVKNYGWVTVTGLWATFSHAFYIVITQLSDAPDCIAVGVDKTPPKVYQSYARNVLSGSPWVSSPYQDLMINALVSTTVGMEAPKVSDEVIVRPNPADNIARLEFPAGLKSISVFDASGQKIIESNVENQTSLSIYTSAYISGVYYIRFSAANGDSFIRKLVVVH
jgi:hypothetical protein